MQEARSQPEEDRPPFKPWPEQDENGVDLSLIRSSLRLTPQQRLRRADLARLSALRLLEIGRLSRERRTEPA